MKNDHLHTELKPRDEHSSVVIHHEEDHQTDLERWLRRTLAGGPMIWVYPIAGLTTLALLAYLLAGTGGGDSRTQSAWQGLIEAREPADIEAVAEQFPNTKAATWAMLLSADANFNDGVERLPAQADAARPLLKKAQEEYQDVLEKAPRDSPQARRAALGLARALEVRNEPEQALAQYKKVADAYPDTGEEKQARRAIALLQAELKKPEAERFYTKLYAYKPPENPLPSPIPGLPGSDLGAGGSADFGDFLKQQIGGAAGRSGLPPALDPLGTPKAKTNLPPDADIPAAPKAGDEAPKADETPGASPAGEPKSPGA